MQEDGACQRYFTVNILRSTARHVVHSAGRDFAKPNWVLRLGRMVYRFNSAPKLELASFYDSVPQLAPVAAPSIFDLLFCLTPIVGGRDQGQCAVDTNQDHRPDFSGGSLLPVHLAHRLEDLTRAMDNPPPF